MTGGTAQGKDKSRLLSEGIRHAYRSQPSGGKHPTYHHADADDSPRRPPEVEAKALCRRQAAPNDSRTLRGRFHTEHLIHARCALSVA